MLADSGSQSANLASPPADRAAPGDRLLLTGRIGDRRYALPVAAVERILRMADLTPLPDAPPQVVGLLNVHGDILPVVDPRPRLGIASPPFDPDQHLLVLTAQTRFLLWIDRVEAVVAVPETEFSAIESGPATSFTPGVVRLGGTVLPVLAPLALDPGPIVRGAARPT